MDYPEVSGPNRGQLTYRCQRGCSRDLEETRKVVTAPVCKIMPQEEWDESIGAGKAYVAVSEA